jgi:hypothetical protein
MYVESNNLTNNHSPICLQAIEFIAAVVGTRTMGDRRGRCRCHFNSAERWKVHGLGGGWLVQSLVRYGVIMGKAEEGR